MGEVLPDIFDSYPVNSGHCRESWVDGSVTRFSIWSPAAYGARVNLYRRPLGFAPFASLPMRRSEGGMWEAECDGDLHGVYYTFNINWFGQWLPETPGMWARAVGPNGEKACLLDMESTDPEGWEADRGPKLRCVTDAVVYELHLRDFSMHPSSGLSPKGKFLSLARSGALPDGQRTGLDHLKELGVTHVQLLPVYDFATVDELRPDSPQYNWGYDPLNYNVPEGSYSSDASDPAARIREFKMMVKALHDAGIGVVMDVVYNHTYSASGSCFSLIAPGYFYRRNADGSLSNASGCGNEIASERPMVRDFIVESMLFWAREYHIDGFRLDLMGALDIATANAAAGRLREVNPSIIIYGEGWTAADSPFPAEKRALKGAITRMPGIAVFADNMRDALRGSLWDSAARGFVSGAPGHEDAVKTGIVGEWSPAQKINYVACHDDLCLADKLAASMPKSTLACRQRAARLAMAVLLTSQGVPFIFAGEEIWRTKRGLRNTYNSPDCVNAIDWANKMRYPGHFRFCRELVRLRREHPAFRMASAGQIARHLVFDAPGQPCVVSYRLIDHANGDSWKEIRLVFNGGDKPCVVSVDAGDWIVVARNGRINARGLGRFGGGRAVVKPATAFIAALRE